MAYATKSIQLASGSSQYATRAKTGSTSLYATGNFTWESWVKMTTLPASGGVMNFYTQSWKTAGNLSFALQLDNTGGTYGVRVRMTSNGTTTTNSVVATFVPVAGVWNHFGIVYTAASGKVEIFYNGVSIGSSTSYPTSIFNGTDDIVFGAEGDFSNKINAQFSLMRFWTTTRTAANLRANWYALLGVQTSLGAEWSFNNVYTDNAGNSNTLTGVNTPTFTTDIPDAPIEFDAITQTNSSSTTPSHTTAGTNRFITLWILTTSATHASATYGGVSMTWQSVQQWGGGNSTWLQCLTLVNPTVGTNSFSITATGLVASTSVSYVNVAQSGQPQVVGSTNATGATSVSMTGTAISNKAWALSAFGNNTGTPTAYTNVTQRGSSLGNGLDVGDSNTAISIGSYTQTASNVAGGAGNNWAQIQIIIAQASSIVFDAAGGTVVSTGSPTTISWTHVVGSASNRALVVFVYNDSGTGGGTDNFTSVTAGGVAMTAVDFVVALTGFTGVKSYILMNPTSGSITITVNTSSSQNQLGADSLSYSGVAQTGQPDSHASNGNQANADTISTTVVTPGSWLVGATRNSAVSATGGAGTRIRVSNNTLSAADSDGIVAAGSQSLIWNFNTGTGGGCIVSLAPVSGPTAYTLAVTTATFTLTGIAATLRRGKFMTAALGSFIITGIAATFRRTGWVGGNTKNAATVINSSRTYAQVNSFATVPPQIAIRNDFTGSVGFEFTVAATTTVNKLARIFAVGSTQNHTIKIWNVSDTVTPIASATVLVSSTSDSNNYKYVTLSTPLVLSVGQTYRIACDENASGDFWRDGWTPGAAVQSNFTVIRGCYTGGQGTYPSNTAFTAGMYDSLAMIYDAPAATSFSDQTKNSSTAINQSKY